MLKKNRKGVFKSSYIQALSLILIGFLVNNFFLLKMKRIVTDKNIIKDYNLVDVNKQWNRSSKYDIYINVNDNLHSITISNETYNKIINKNFKPIVYRDNGSNKYYTRHSLNIYYRMNYFILFLFIFFSAYFLYYYLNYKKHR